MRYLLFLLAFPLLALDNSVRLYDASGSAQTSQPRTIHRYFAQGEFPSGYYPKPRVGGSVPATWQVDVESVWPDLSVMAAFVSLPVSITANGSAVVDFVPDPDPCHLGNLATCTAAGLDQSGMLAFNSSAWDAIFTGTANAISYSANARTMMGAGACSQYLMKGPVVSRVLCEDFTRPNPTYDFGWQWDAAANLTNAANAIGAFGAAGKRIGIRVQWQAVTAGTRGAVTTITLPGHGLTTGQQIRLIKGDYEWAALNGVHTVTSTGTDTFTVPVDSSAFADPGPATTLRAVPTNVAIGIGSTDSLTPTDGVFVRVAWPELQLVVRNGGAETTLNFGNADTREESVFELASDPLSPTSKIHFLYNAWYIDKTICSSGCDYTVASGWAATNFLPIRRFQSAEGAAATPGGVIDRPDSWIAPSSDTYKSIHPLFTLTFYTGWAGVEVELMALNAATTRVQRQVFDIAVTKYSGTSVYARPAFDFIRSSAFTRYFWDGTAPAAVQVDFNLKYMIYSRILPPYDWRQARQGGTDVGEYDSSVGSNDPQDCNLTRVTCGNWTLHIPGGGARGDIGLIPRFFVTYFYGMSDTTTYTVAQRLELMNKQVIGNADAAMTLPVQYLEYDNSSVRDSSGDGQRYYLDSSHTTPAFGRVISTYARPEWIGGDRESTTGADKILPLCTAGPCSANRWVDMAYQKSWELEMGHMPSPFAVPYMLTGRYSYLVAQLGLAAYSAGRESYAYYYDAMRGQDWSIMARWGNHRESAWPLRDIGLAALIAPSARPEKAYFTKILEKNDEFWEGVGGISGGNAGTTTDVNFCRGADLGSASWTHTSSSDTGFNGWTMYKLNGTARVLGMPEPIYSVTTVTVDGASKTVGVRGVDTGRDFYYYPGGYTLWQDEGASPVGLGSTVAMTYRKTATNVSPWCTGRHLNMKGMSPALGHQLWNESRAYSAFHLYYFLWTRKYLGDTEAFTHSATGQPLFKFSNQSVATHVIGWATHPDANPHYADMYTSYNVDSSNELASTWAGYMGVFAKTSTISADMTNSATTFYVNDSHASWPYTLHQFFAPILVKVEDEWISLCSWYESSSPNISQMTVCTGGRGMFGTAAVAHSTGAAFSWDRQQWNGPAVGHNYPNLYASTVAMFEEFTVLSGSGRRAWERVTGDMHGAQDRMTEPEYAFVPRDRIAHIRATPGTGTLSLAWTAPSPAACVVALNPTTSDDSGDTAATGTSRAQSFSATGLSAGATTYRITCGTARSTGTVTVQ